MACADAATAAWVSTTPFGAPVDPLVAIDERVAARRPPRPSSAWMPVVVDERGRAPSRRAAPPARGARQPAIDREHGVAGVPLAAQRVDERRRRPAGRSRRDVARSGGYSATMAAMNRWLVGARPRTLPAAVVPVALGAAAAAGEPGPVWWRAVARARGEPRPAGRRQLRQRLQRRRARHRRGPRRARPSGGRRVWRRAAAVKRAAFAAFGVAAVGRARARRRHHVVAARRRCRGHPRRLVLHRRAEAVRLPRARRGVRVRVLRARRHGRDGVRGVPAHHGRRLAGGLHGRAAWRARCWW